MNYNIKKNEDSILKDIKNGKDRDWRGKKLMSIALGQSYERLDNNKFRRVYDCGSYLEFRKTKRTQEFRLTASNFCKVRLCPLCAWRRSLKVFGQVSRVMDHMEKNANYKYIFLTLTVKNCYGEELKDRLDDMTKAFNKMNQRVAFKNAVKGYFRSLEITFNRVDNTYHPHFHMILAVNNSYFTDTKYYLSQNKWTNLWKDCLGVEYIPIVDVRRLENNGHNKGVAEVAKYTVKASDFIIQDEKGNIIEEKTDEVVSILDEALHRKRLISFGFDFKEAHNKLNLDDAEQGNLIDTDNQNIREDLEDIIYRYSWNIGLKNYILIENN